MPPTNAQRGAGVAGAAAEGGSVRWEGKLRAEDTGEASLTVKPHTSLHPTPHTLLPPTPYTLHPPP